MGIVSAMNSNQLRAERLIRYSEAMSRRDLGTQLWLIENNVGREDIPAALLHYDRALRANDDARPILFPILSQAADDPAISPPLASFLARRPQWWRPFLNHYVPNATSPDALHSFAKALNLDRAPSPDPSMLQAIEKRLVDLFAYAPAAALYNRAHGLPADDRAPLRNGNFEQPGNWDPFDWNLIDEQDLAALRQPSPIQTDGNALFLSATNGRGGDLAVQLIMLPPGTYAIHARVGGVHGDPLAFPRLVIRCAKSGREILNLSFPQAPDNGRSWHTTVTIPADCEAQRIVLRASSTLDANPALPWIDNIAIRFQGGR